MSDSEATEEIIEIDRESLRSTNMKGFKRKEVYYLKTIDKYFRNDGSKNVSKMIGIINKTSNISLRMLDWFAAKYTKKHKKKVVYKLGDDLSFSVRISYKAQLDSFTKKHFDPFRRRKKFNYHYDKTKPNQKIYTTIGQLNFFMWIFQKNIINYIEENYDTLVLFMKQSNKDDKKKKEDKKTKKVEKVKEPKEKITIKANKEVKNKQVSVTLTFD